MMMITPGALLKKKSLIFSILGTVGTFTLVYFILGGRACRKDKLTYWNMDGIEITSPMQLELDDSIGKLKPGQIEFNPPLKMQQFRKERIEVRISQSLTEELVKDLRGRGYPIIEDIKVSPLMKAVLVGDTFRIETHSEAIQPILSEGYTQWEWDVVPQRYGNRTLNLTVSAVIKTKLGDTIKSYPVMDKIIRVTIGWPPFGIFLKYLGIIVGIIGGLFGLIRTAKDIIRGRTQKPHTSNRESLLAKTSPPKSYPSRRAANSREALITLFNDIREELRSRREAEYLYTAAVIAAYGAVIWGMAVIASSTRAMHDIPLYVHPATYAAFGCVILAKVVIDKIRSDHENYKKIFTDMTNIYQELLSSFKLIDHLKFPPEAGLGFRGSVKIVIGGALAAILFCIIALITTKCNF
jgi:hypothetical protein